MKTFKTKAEYLAYHAAKSLKAYHKKMSNPVTAELYRVKRRAYEKKKYREMLKDLE